jgi:hypothetical protein
MSSILDESLQGSQGRRSRLSASARPRSRAAGAAHRRVPDARICMSMRLELLSPPVRSRGRSLGKGQAQTCLTAGHSPAGERLTIGACLPTGARMGEATRIGCHEQSQEVHRLQVGGSQVVEDRLSAGRRWGGLRYLPALRAMRQGKPQRRNGCSLWRRPRLAVRAQPRSLEPIDIGTPSPRAPRIARRTSPHQRPARFEGRVMPPRTNHCGRARWVGSCGSESGLEVPG